MVGRDIARVLGDNFSREDQYLEGDKWIVTWAFGHLLQLADPEVYDPDLKRWTMQTLPFVPDEFKVRARDTDARTQLKKIKALIDRADVDQVINACDAGREGELIFAYVWQALKGAKPVQRLWISSLTDKAIKEGFSKLRPASEMASLEAAARARSEADWIVGLNATRAATIKCRQAVDGVVSLGRVQTPTLALLVAREREIQAFVPETFFTVKAQFEHTNDRAYTGSWFSGKETRFKDKQAAEAVVSKVKGQPGVVKSVEVKPVREKAPLLYDLTTLQQEANKRYGFNADRTLELAQSLYEVHKALTYPRTSSRYLSTDMEAAIPVVAQRLKAVATYEPFADWVIAEQQAGTLAVDKVVDDSKVTDHHAIIPTDSQHNPAVMDPDEKKIFDMVCRRFLAVFHPDAVFEQTEIITEAVAETFRTRGKVLIEPGWRAVYGSQSIDEKKKDGDEGQAQLPKLEQGEAGTCVDAVCEEKQTKPPARFNDSTLLGVMKTAGKLVDDDELAEAMKESGLGTPATRAAIIKTLIARSYVARKGKDLVPTAKAMEILGLVDGHPLTSATLTGSWEKRLGEIEKGTADRDTFMRDIAAFTKETVDAMAALKVEAKPLDPGQWGHCPRCGDKTGAVIRETSKGYSCSSWQSREDPGCGFVIWKQYFGKTLGKRAVQELIRDGKTKDKLSGFKTPDGTPFASQLVIDPQSGKVVLPRELEIREAPPLGPCPFCKTEMVKESLRAYSCTSYKGKDDPGCGFTIWKTMSGKRIDRKTATEIVQTGKTAAVLEGFTSKAGKPFSARLVVDPAKRRVSFQFEDRRPAPQQTAA